MLSCWGCNINYGLCDSSKEKWFKSSTCVEAGIRSNDLKMPEEINRIVTDSITDYFFTTSKTANLNLLKAGVNEEKIFFVGNTMIDTLLRFKKNFIKPKLWNDLKLCDGNYFILTLHRPSNVDENNFLLELIKRLFNAQEVFQLFSGPSKNRFSFKKFDLRL